MPLALLQQKPVLLNPLGPYFSSQEPRPTGRKIVPEFPSEIRPKFSLTGLKPTQFPQQMRHCHTLFEIPKRTKKGPKHSRSEPPPPPPQATHNPTIPTARNLTSKHHRENKTQHGTHKQSPALICLYSRCSPLPKSRKLICTQHCLNDVVNSKRWSNQSLRTAVSTQPLTPYPPPPPPQLCKHFFRLPWSKQHFR